MAKYAILHIPTGKYIYRSYDIDIKSYDFIFMECFTEEPKHYSLLGVYFYYFTLNLNIYDNLCSRIEDKTIKINRNELTILRITK